MRRQQPRLANPTSKVVAFDLCEHHYTKPCVEVPYTVDGCEILHQLRVFFFSNYLPYGSLWLFNIAMENGPFIDGLPMVILHGYVK